MQSYAWILILVLFFLLGMGILYLKMVKNENYTPRLYNYENAIVTKELCKDKDKNQTYFFVIYHEKGNTRVEVTKEVFDEYDILDKYYE